MTFGGERVSGDRVLPVIIVVNADANAKRREKSPAYVRQLVLFSLAEKRVSVDSSVLIQQHR